MVSSCTLYPYGQTLRPPPHPQMAAARNVDLHKLCEIYKDNTKAANRIGPGTLGQLEKLITQNKYCTTVSILLFGFAPFFVRTNPPRR